MRPWWQSARETINGVLLATIHHAADAAFGVDPVHVAIFMAGVLGADLVNGLQPLEVPIYVIRGTNIGAHGLILLQNRQFVGRIADLAPPIPLNPSPIDINKWWD